MLSLGTARLQAPRSGDLPKGLHPDSPGRNMLDHSLVVLAKRRSSLWQACVVELPEARPSSKSTALLAFLSRFSTIHLSALLPCTGKTVGIEALRITRFR